MILFIDNEKKTKQQDDDNIDDDDEFMFDHLILIDGSLTLVDRDR